MANKGKVIYAEPEKEQRAKFDALKKHYRMTMKALVLWMIEEKYNEVLDSQDENSMVSEKRGI